MGGTSYDLCLIRGGRPEIKMDWNWRHRYCIGIPMVDIPSVGAGGGSCVGGRRCPPCGPAVGRLRAGRCELWPGWHRAHRTDADLCWAGSTRRGSPVADAARPEARPPRSLAWAPTASRAEAAAAATGDWSTPTTDAIRRVLSLAGADRAGSTSSPSAAWEACTPPHRLRLWGCAGCSCRAPLPACPAWAC